MTARIIDGKAVAATLRAELAARVATLAFQPGLTVILVGDDPASAVYVRSKDRAAKEAGILAQTIRMPAETAQATLLAEIARLNADPEVDGILVQLPLPGHIDAQAVIAAIDPGKDVDGFHPVNVGALAGGQPGLVPCTPAGVMKLLRHAGATLAGARALVLGRSAIVGRPVAALLLAADATVTIAHSRTRDLAAECDHVVCGERGRRVYRQDRRSAHRVAHRQRAARRTLRYAAGLNPQLDGAVGGHHYHVGGHTERSSDDQDVGRVRVLRHVETSDAGISQRIVGNDTSEARVNGGQISELAGKGRRTANPVGVGGPISRLVTDPKNR